MNTLRAVLALTMCRRHKLYQLLLKSLSVVFLLAINVCAHAQISEEAARQRAVDLIRTKEFSFLGVKRDEDLEQTLAIAANRKPGNDFIYILSSDGYEFTGNAIIEHMLIDGSDAPDIVVVDRTTGIIYVVHGFADSMEQFQRLTLALEIKAMKPSQAEAIAEWYRKANPHNYVPIDPVSSILDFKQAAERLCSTRPFEKGEKKFEAWWRKGASSYLGKSFDQTVVPTGSGYLVEWSVLDFSKAGSCGAPLRAQLEVRSDGQVGKLSFSPYRSGAGLSHEATRRAQGTSVP